jgi:hypothetical protein
MTIDTLTISWTALALLGAFHGINPGMGWLFAVALGMQDRREATVWRALLPLSLGHALAIAAAVGVAAAAGAAIPARPLQWTVGVLLIALGVWRILRCRHPRFGGMRVGARDLTVWSFLMASAHGAGLMVLPFVVGGAGTGVDASAHAHHDHAAHMAQAAPAADGLSAVLAATLVHSAGYLVVTALAAWIVYRFVGVAMLRRAWINLDLVWAVALVVTGIVALGV